MFYRGGVNDFLSLEKSDSLLNYYKQIVHFWKNESKIPVINLITFISPKASVKYASINKAISEMNISLKNFAAEEKIDIVDMNIYLSDLNEKILKQEYTIDGVHYTTSAYLIWAEKIKDILKKNKI